MDWFLFVQTFQLNYNYSKLSYLQIVFFFIPIHYNPIVTIFSSQTCQFATMNLASRLGLWKN